MSRKLIFVLALTVTGSTVTSQEINDSTKALSEVVVTANKYPSKQNETGKVITVITQEQIQKSYGKNLAEILNQQVGVNINGATNSAGTNQTVYVRGAASANTLILVDGVPLYDASGTSSEFDLNNFSLYNIERIEILKGSQSTLYGSDAVAGVINIITKKTSGKAAQVNLVASAGSYGSYKAALSVGGKLNGVEYFIGFNKIISKGMSAAYDSAGTRNFEKDPFRQQIFNASVGGDLFKKFNARIYTKYNENRTDIDAGAFTDDRDYRLKNRNLMTGTRFVYSFPLGTLNFNYNYNWYKRYLKDDSGHIGGNLPGYSFYNIFQEGSFKSKSQFAELYSNLKFSKHLELLTGIDFRKNGSDQMYTSISNYGAFATMPLSEDSIRTKQYSAFASLSIKELAGFFTDLGGRWNHHSVYGDNLTWSFSEAYVYKNWKLFANLSSGYRAPSLYQLYSEYGNKDLKPEESTNMEGGIQFSSKNFNSRLVVFSRKTTDVFTFYTDPVTFAGKYINEDQQKDHGIEAEVSYKPGKFSINANYTNVDGRITTDNGSGKDTTYFNLYRRPEHSFNFNIGINLTDKFYMQAGVHLVSRFFEPVFLQAPEEMKGYHTINLYSEYKFGKRYKLFVDIRNITNEKYFEAKGFNSKRFNVDGGVSLTL